MSSGPNRKRRKRRLGEITCTCPAYPFPHRLMGGRCSGSSFVHDFFSDNMWGECRQCRYCFVEDGLECEVCNGLEPSWECPGLSEFLDRAEVPVPKKLRRKRWQ